MESLYDYGSRAGFWRLHDLLVRKNVQWWVCVKIEGRLWSRTNNFLRALYIILRGILQRFSDFHQSFLKLLIFDAYWEWRTPVICGAQYLTYAVPLIFSQLVSWNQPPFISLTCHLYVSIIRKHRIRRRHGPRAKPWCLSRHDSSGMGGGKSWLPLVGLSKYEWGDWEGAYSKNCSDS